jgi:hypothetical protein
LVRPSASHARQGSVCAPPPLAQEARFSNTRYLTAVVPICHLPEGSSAHCMTIAPSRANVKRTCHLGSKAAQCGRGAPADAEHRAAGLRAAPGRRRAFPTTMRDTTMVHQALRGRDRIAGRRSGYGYVRRLLLSPPPWYQAYQAYRSQGPFGVSSQLTPATLSSGWWTAIRSSPSISVARARAKGGLLPEPDPTTPLRLVPPENPTPSHFKPVGTSHRLDLDWTAMSNDGSGSAAAPDGHRALSTSAQ